MNKTKITLGIALVAFLLVSLVSAFGVSSPYWGDRPLQMYAGQVVVVPVNLQNMVGNEDFEVSATVTSGKDIASVMKDNYLVRSQTHEVNANVKIVMPSNAKIGDTRKVVIEFKTSPPGESGSISMGTAAIIGFDVITVEKPVEPSNIDANTVLLLSLAVVLLILVIFFLIRKNKSNKAVLTKVKGRR